VEKKITNQFLFTEIGLNNFRDFVECTFKTHVAVITQLKQLTVELKVLLGTVIWV